MASIEITGRNYEVPDRIRKLIESKLEKLKKFFTDIIEIRCVLAVEKYRNICEIIVIGKDYDVKSVQEADAMDDAVHSTLDHLKLQAQKNRKKIRDHHRRTKGVPPTSWQVNVIDAARLRGEPATTPRIIKTNNLPIRPMSIEQAAMLLDDSKNEFIVFRDLDTDKVSVIYKRRDNNLGLIAPEF